MATETTTDIDISHEEEAIQYVGFREDGSSELIRDNIKMSMIAEGATVYILNPTLFESLTKNGIPQGLKKLSDASYTETLLKLAKKWIKQPNNNARRNRFLKHWDLDIPLGLYRCYPEHATLIAVIKLILKTPFTFNDFYQRCVTRAIFVLSAYATPTNGFERNFCSLLIQYGTMEYLFSITDKLGFPNDGADGNPCLDYVRDICVHLLSHKDLRGALRKVKGYDAFATLVDLEARTKKNFFQCSTGLKSCFGRGRCAGCGKLENESGEMKKCGKCRLALFCSRDCQKRNWSKHKLMCKKSRST